MKRDPTGTPSIGDEPLFDQPWNKPVEKPVQASLEFAFRQYHRDSPQVLGWLIADARALKATGAEKGSIARLIELLRWDPERRINHTTFKIPNAHRAFYARLVMHRAPDLDGFFDLARQKGASVFDPSTVTP